MGKPMNQETEQKNKGPVKKFKSGGLEVDIWENTGNKNGKDFSFSSTSVQRSYTTDNGKTWNKMSISSLKVNDLPKLILLLGLAYKELVSGTTEEQEE